MSMRSHFELLALVLTPAVVALLVSVSPSHAQNADRPTPTRANVEYGPHERNVLDFWQAESDRPTPLVVYIHGGGFRNGSKDGINVDTLQQLLSARISVAALNYRYAQQVPLPAAHYDCRRALKLLRSRAEEWNIDKTRVGAFGGSAGAQLCMYLAFHDDMAKPDSSDPLERESTRLSCVATGGGQTTMDQDWWTKHIPGYEAAHRNFFETFGVTTQEEYMKKVAEVSALSLITADDPPIFMTYGMAPDEPVPSDSQRANGWKVHHVAFGVELKNRMDALGIEAVLKYPGAETRYQSNADFLIAQLASSAQDTPDKAAASEPVPRTPRSQDRGRQVPPAMIARIKANDRNNDGKITQEEASPQLKRMFFSRIDTSGDGTIDKTELAKFVEQASSGPARAEPQPAQPPSQQQADRRRAEQNRPASQVPDNVQLLTDIVYREGNEKWKLDLVLPKDRADAARPALVIVHGGGWRGGDKGGGVWRSFPLAYAAKGYVCISVNYRLTDQAAFPACVADVKCAVRWLRAHAAKYNVDPERLGAYGNSAGAHLVAMLGLVGPDAQLEGDGPYQDESSLVQAVCCSATPTDFLNWRDDSPGEFSKRGLLKGDENTFLDRARKASPLTYVRATAPPFLVVHGTADRTVPIAQGDRFVEALKKAGASDVTYIRIDDAGHGVFNQHQDKTHPAMQEFFARTIGNPSASAKAR